MNVYAYVKGDPVNGSDPEGTDGDFLYINNFPTMASTFGHNGFGTSGVATTGWYSTESSPLEQYRGGGGVWRPDPIETVDFVSYKIPIGSNDAARVDSIFDNAPNGRAFWALLSDNCATTCSLALRAIGLAIGNDVVPNGQAAAIRDYVAQTPGASATYVVHNKDGSVTATTMQTGSFTYQMPGSHIARTGTTVVASTFTTPPAEKSTVSECPTHRSGGCGKTN